MSTVRATIRELAAIAVEQVGGCLALAWEPVRLDRPGARPLSFRLVHVLFRSRREAQAFHEALARRNLTRMGRRAVGERTVHDHLGMLRGWAATAVVSPAWDSPAGLHVIATPAGRQPGVAAQAARREAAWLAAERREARPGGDDDELGALGSAEPTGRLRGHFDLLEPGAEPEQLDERLGERLLERDLAAIEGELDARLAADPRYFPSFAALWAHVSRRRGAERRPAEAAPVEAPPPAGGAATGGEAPVGEAAPRRASRAERLRQDAEEVRGAARGKGGDADWLGLRLELRRRGLLPAVSAEQHLDDERRLAALRGRAA